MGLCPALMHRPDTSLHQRVGLLLNLVQLAHSNLVLDPLVVSLPQQGSSSQLLVKLLRLSVLQAHSNLMLGPLVVCLPKLASSLQLLAKLLRLSVLLAPHPILGQQLASQPLPATKGP
jgi:hypothetical protein